MSLLLSILLFAAGADSLGMSSCSASEALFSHRKAFTSVEAGWKGRSEAQPLIPEEGSQAGEGVVDIRTIVRPDSASVVTGKVHYANGFKNNVRWQSSSDFGTVFPYVMADTLSGNVRKETYAFTGGYAFRRGAWNFGFRGSYRALHEWREVDPRPRNIVSDLMVSASSGRQLSDAYVLDLTASYRRYSQSNSVSFFNPRGANTAEFHLTGLGSDFKRFSGTISSYLYTRYSGNGASLAVTLFPLKERGWKSSVEYDMLSIVHHLPNLNEVPYTKLITNTLRLKADYLGGKWSAGAKAHAQLRTGIENVLDNGIAGAYNCLTSFHMYTGVFYEAEAHGRVDIGPWNLSSEAAYRGFYQKYAYPERLFSTSGIRANVKASYTIFAGQWLLRPRAALLAYLPLSGNMKIPSEYTMEAMQEYMRSRLLRLTSTTVGGFAAFYAERPVWNAINAYASTSFYYDILNSVIYSVTIGLKF